MWLTAILTGRRSRWPLLEQVGRTGIRLGAVLSLAMLLGAADKVDLEVLQRIKSEAFENSHVMDHVFYLSDVYGPRVTNSPGFVAAADWASKRLRDYGLTNVNLESWGPFGRSWANTHFCAHMIQPAPATLIGVPLAWTAGTPGPITGEAVLAEIRSAADFDKYRGKLRGKVVLMQSAKDLTPHYDPTAKRYTDADLARLSLFPDPAPARPLPPVTDQPALPKLSGAEQTRLWRNAQAQFYAEEGALVVLSNGNGGEGGTVIAGAGGSHDSINAVSVPMVALTAEHYNRIVRLVQHNIPVKLEFDIRNTIQQEQADSFNILAEIRGHAREHEVVMLGAHFDSWQGGTGATDNAAGVAVMMEAVRILKALDLPMDRTVRLALWGGEEQGALGSKAYVKAHFGDPDTFELHPEQAKISAYFNYDFGTGKIRGIYLENNDRMRPIFEAWIEPLKDLGVTTLGPRKTGASDHYYFNAVGVPGFLFIQDPIHYFTLTHHSNMDVYDHVQSIDLMQSAVVVASFVYNAAIRGEMLPRSPIPKPKLSPATQAGHATVATQQVGSR
jgi:carboxypeptidase Q